MGQDSALDEVRKLARQVGIRLTDEEERLIAQRLEDMGERLRQLERVEPN